MMTRNALPTAGSVLGIDVGFSPTRKSSAVCRLDWNLQHVELAITRFRAVEPERTDSICRLLDRPVEAVALDGPLRGDLQVIGRYRLAERLLTLRLRPLIGKPGQASALVGRSLNLHTNLCAATVLATALVRPSRHTNAIHASAIVEAFPTSFMGVLIDEPGRVPAKRGNRSDVYFQHLATTGGFAALLDHLLPGRRVTTALGDVTNHDDRAALVCALTALAVAAGDFSQVGDDDGWIVLPLGRWCVLGHARCLRRTQPVRGFTSPASAEARRWLGQPSPPKKPPGFPLAWTGASTVEGARPVRPTRISVAELTAKQLPA
jgi:hypothetical protein